MSRESDYSENTKGISCRQKEQQEPGRQEAIGVLEGRRRPWEARGAGHKEKSGAG